MRKTKRFAPLVSGLLIIIFLSIRSNDKLVVEQIFGDEAAVMIIVAMYAIAIYVIIRGLTAFTREFDLILDKIIGFMNSGVRRINDV